MSKEVSVINQIIADEKFERHLKRLHESRLARMELKAKGRQRDPKKSLFAAGVSV